MKLLLQTQKKVSKFLTSPFRRRFKRHYLNSIFRLDKVEAAVLVTVCFLLFIHSSHAAILANRSTNATGNWATASIWTGSVVPAAADNVTVNHALTLNANLSVTGTYTLNSTVTDAAGGTAYAVTINSGGTLEVKADMIAEGALIVNSGGKLIIRSGATLTVGATTFTSGGSSSILIEEGATLIVNGLFTNNNSNVEIDGDVNVKGKISTGGGSVITGTGTVSTTLSGSAGTITNNGSIFGNTDDCNSGTCSFISPCNADATSPSISSSAPAVCTGASVTLSAVVYSGATYQWQSSATGITYANITGATNSTYVASPASTTYYKLRVSYNTGGCIYVTNSAVMITVNGKSTIPTSSTGTSTICSGLSAVVGASGGTLASDAVTALYQGACPAFTEDWGGTSSPWTITNGTTINYVSGGYMNVSALAGTPTDPQIMMKPTGASYNPNTYKYIKVRYRVNSGNPGNIQIYFLNGTYPNADPNAVVVSSALITDGNWNIATIDMSASSNWTTGGNITGWRFDYATDVANMDIDYIMLTAPSVSSPVSPTATTQYYVRYEGLCNSTACLGTPVTVTVKPTPTIATTSPNNRCGTGSVSIGATASAGTVNWYDGLGVSLTTGTSYATPNLLATTTYYVDATNNGCTTASRTAVTATINPCAISWLGVTSTDWNATTNWNLGIIPTTINSITIPSGTPFSPRVTSGVGSVSSIVINSGAALTITSTGVLNVYGNISTVGTGTIIANAGSTVAFKGSSAQTITGVPVLYNVQIANTSGGVALLSALTVKGALSLISGVLTTNSNLTINFDNGGNIPYKSTDAGSISGNVSGRRDAAARTHYLASPFSGATSAQIQATTPLYVNNYWKMYTKNFDTQGWAAVTTITTAMPIGTGFSLAMPAAAPLILTGTYSHNASFTSPDYSNAAAAKYILIGNPYPSAINWDSTGWVKTNVADAVYYWNPSNNSMASYVGGYGTNGGTKYIPAMQSFMVATKGTGGPKSSVSVNNAARVNLQNPSYFRTTSSMDEIIRIKLTGANADAWDDAVIRFNEQATNSFDFDWDAYKIMSRGQNPLIYTTLGGEIYSINSVSGIASLPVVDVVVYIPSEGNYTLNIANSDPTTEYILIDKKLETENVVSGSYVFSGSPTDDVNRFQLKLRTTVTTGTKSSNTSAALQIMSSTKGFVIQTAQFGGGQADIQLLDMTGNSVEVLNNTTLTTGSTYVPVDVADGAYLVKVTINGNVFTGMISLIR